MEVLPVKRQRECLHFVHTLDSLSKEYSVITSIVLVFIVFRHPYRPIFRCLL